MTIKSLISNLKLKIKQSLPAKEGKNSEVGQSLLEVTVLVGLALITVSGLVIVTVNSLKNSQYSQNQAQATKLAQEGMDEVKSIAERNCLVNYSGNFFWYNSQVSSGNDLVWSQDWSGGPHFKINAPNYATCNEFTVGMIGGGAAILDLAPTATNIFTRNIVITDDAGCGPPSSCKVVTVTVSWDDYSGSHESRLATILTEH